MKPNFNGVYLALIDDMVIMTVETDKSCSEFTLTMDEAREVYEGLGRILG